MSRYLASAVGGLTVAAVVLASLAAPQTTAAVAAAEPTAVFAACPAGTAGGARCGTVAVPLDRANPGGGTIRIAFQLYPATDRSRPAYSAHAVRIRAGSMPGRGRSHQTSSPAAASTSTVASTHPAALTWSPVL